MKFLFHSILFSFFIASLFFIGACKHQPLPPMDIDDMTPIDTTSIDSIPIDTIDEIIPCEPDVVYFNRDVLPIFISNCAFSGCHDAATAQDGVLLDTYENVFNTGDVRPFELDNSDLYEVLVDEDEEDRMPPPPTDRLNATQIQIIAQWILQGAQDLECDEDAGLCETDDVSYADQIQPVVLTHCQGCHSGSSPSGGIDLSDYNGLKTVADNGALVGAISWEQGFENMPQGGDQLSDCIIDQITSWVNDGAPNN